MNVDRKLYSLDTQELGLIARKAAFMVDSAMALNITSYVAGVVGLALGEPHVAGIAGILGVISISKYVLFNNFYIRNQVNRVLNLRGISVHRSRTERFISRILDTNFDN